MMKEKLMTNAILGLGCTSCSRRTSPTRTTRWRSTTSVEAFAEGAWKPGVAGYTYQFTVTGLGSGNPQIASLGVRQDIEALDK